MKTSTARGIRTALLLALASWLLIFYGCYLLTANADTLVKCDANTYFLKSQNPSCNNCLCSGATGQASSATPTNLPATTGNQTTTTTNTTSTSVTNTTLGTTCENCEAMAARNAALRDLVKRLKKQCGKKCATIK